jgi:uncharacterized protein (TIGR02594 family)
MVVLRKGDKGADVAKLQRLLNSALHPSPGLTEDGDFGSRTEAAVKIFQQQNGLAADGVVGPQTWTALGEKISRLPKPMSPAPPGPPVGTGSNWYAIAQHEIGVHEDSLPGHHTARIVEYHSTTSLKATDDETPWCSSFVNWCMKQAGIQGTGSAAAKSWLGWGQTLQDSREGAVVVIKKKSSGSDHTTGSSSGFHVAFFVSKTQTHIRLLGGNQSDQVKYSNFSLSAYEVKGYRWPPS